MKLESIIVPLTDQQLDGKLYCFYIVQYFDLDQVTAESMFYFFQSRGMSKCFFFQKRVNTCTWLETFKFLK